MVLVLFFSQQEYDKLEESWKEGQGHTNFVKQMIVDVKNGTRFTLFPRPHVVNSAETILVFGACVACGEPLESAHVVGLFMLSCRHQYHPLCFSAVLHSRKTCAKPGCDMVIPEEARSWINGIYVVKNDEVADATTGLKTGPSKFDASHVFDVDGDWGKSGGTGGFAVDGDWGTSEGGGFFVGIDTLGSEPVNADGQKAGGDRTPTSGSESGFKEDVDEDQPGNVARKKRTGVKLFGCKPEDTDAFGEKAAENPKKGEKADDTKKKEGAEIDDGEGAEDTKDKEGAANEKKAGAEADKGEGVEGTKEGEGAANAKGAGVEADKGEGAEGTKEGEGAVEADKGEGAEGTKEGEGAANAKGAGVEADKGEGAEDTKEGEGAQNAKGAGAGAEANKGKGAEDTKEGEGVQNAKGAGAQAYKGEGAEDTREGEGAQNEKGTGAGDTSEKVAEDAKAGIDEAEAKSAPGDNIDDAVPLSEFFRKQRTLRKRSRAL